MTEETRDRAKELIKANIDCRQYLTKAPTGQYICPLCGSGTGADKSGACKYYEKTNTFYCHSCNNEQIEGKRGDILDLIQAEEQCDYNEALRICADKIGITIIGDNENRKNNDIKKNIEKKDRQPIRIIKAAETENKEPEADYTMYYKVCADRLKESKEAILYLLSRGISLNTAQAFNCGYDPEADPANFPGDITNGKKFFPVPRIIIPASKATYTTRAITEAKLPKANPKGALQAITNLSCIYDFETVFVCEASFDAMSLIEIGAVALSLNSTSNTDLLIKAIKEKPTKANFIIVFDNDPDEKTKEATTTRALQLKNDLCALGNKAIVFDIAPYTKPGEKDLNDIIKRENAELERLVTNAYNELNADELTDFFDKIQTTVYKPYKTGMKFFDSLLGGGIMRQTLLFLMAPPGTGKTSLCLSMCETVAKEKKPVIFLNLEMSTEQMLAKAISGRLCKKGYNISATKVLQGYSWTEEQKEAISKEIGEYRAEIHNYMKYKPDGVTTDINSIMSYLKAQGEAAKAAGSEAPAVVVDYIHLITTTEKIDNTELIKKAVTSLKQYAIDYDTFVIGILATNRESNKSGKMTLSSGRDSSNLEYTADYQLSLNYADIDSGIVKPDEVSKISQLEREENRRLILRLHKNRFGRSNEYRQIYFNAEKNTFYDYADGFLKEESNPFNIGKYKR